MTRTRSSRIARARASTASTTSTWASRRMTSSRRPCTSSRWAWSTITSRPRWTRWPRCSGKAPGIRRHRENGPHTPDGCRPLTLGQEFSGYAAQISRARRACARPSSGSVASARRDRDRDRPRQPPGVRGEGSRADPKGHRHRYIGAARTLRGPRHPRLAGRSLGCAHGRGRLADQDRHDFALMGSGPRAGSPNRDCPRPRRAPRSCPARSTRSSPSL